jgi:hypothetical protein
LLWGNPTDFANMVQAVFQKRPFHTAQHTSEAILQAVIEILCPYPCISELSLLVDPSKAVQHGRDGRLDIFMSSHSAAVAIELQNITLFSLWKASAEDGEPSRNELEVLREVLSKETEEQLLRRRWSYYDKTTCLWHTTSVQTVKDDAVLLAQNYLHAIKGGMAKNSNVGILDQRVHCIEGHDHIYGYVMMCVGSRILTWAIGNEEVDKHYI